MRTRILADFVLAFDGRDHRSLTDGEVVVSGSTIESVGPRQAPATSASVDQEIKLGQALLMPGLIDLDALADIDHAVIDSCWGAAHTRGLTWSEDYFRHRRTDVFSRDDKKFIRWYALYQLALHGITTAMPIASEVHSEWAEDFDDATDIASAAADLGLRVYAGPSYRSGVKVELSDGRTDVLFDEDRGRQGLADAVRFLQWTRQQDSDLVHGALLPCRIETLTDDLMTATARVAREFDVPVRLHCLQGIFEREVLARQGRGTPVDALRRAGLLNERLLIPHGVYVDSSSYLGATGQSDVAAIAAAGASVVHCPLTSLRYGSALESFGRYRTAGINLCLGTDSFPPDLVRGMDVGVNVMKVVDRRIDAAGAADYLRAATLGGAAALHRPDLGRIAPGAAADLTAFPLDDVRDGVLADPVRTLLYNGNARNTRLSMVAGRVVVRNGAIENVDNLAVRRRAQDIFDRMVAAYSERDVERRPTEELFPPSFPPAGPVMGG